MSIEGLSLVKLRIILSAIIAVIVLQATPTTPLATHRDHGSAFSASTSEVAVLIRRDGGEQSPVAPQPLPTPVLAVPPTVAIDRIVRSLAGHQSYQRGPPLVAPVRLPHASVRAPPFRV